MRGESVLKFYKCLNCDSVFCSNDLSLCESCNGKLEELVINNDKALSMKLVPVYEVKGDKVFIRVGELEHPMDDNHFINYVFIVNDDSIDRVSFNPGENILICVDYNKGTKVYAYCNIHGLFMCEIH